MPCPLAEAHFLEVDPGTPVLRIEQTTFDAEGRPFEHLESYFRGDKFILVAELRNDQPALAARRPTRQRPASRSAAHERGFTLLAVPGLQAAGCGLQA